MHVDVTGRPEVVAGELDDATREQLERDAQTLERKPSRFDDPDWVRRDNERWERAKQIEEKQRRDRDRRLR